MKKGIITAIVIVLIIAAIVTLEQIKPERAAVVKQEISATHPAEANARIAEKAARYQKAVELVQPDGYINTAPFNLSEYVGKKVILVDFWTYSCINCQRTLPYITSWDAKYKDQGLLIVGVHTPEFDFEKDKANVERAVQKFGIHYPVVQDNEYRTWNAYDNHYWPHHYLIDIDGYIVDDHIGEGSYEETEANIQRLLEERSEVLGLNMSITHNITKETAGPGNVQTAEVYLGYGFSRNQFGQAWNPEKVALYKAPAARAPGMFYLDGSWRSNNDNMEATSPGILYLNYGANDLYMVAGAATPTQVQVFVDGKNVRNVTVEHQELYTLAENLPGQHQLELHVQPGVRIYTFTFG